MSFLLKIWDEKLTGDYTKSFINLWLSNYGPRWIVHLSAIAHRDYSKRKFSKEGKFDPGTY